MALDGRYLIPIGSHLAMLVSYWSQAESAPSVMRNDQEQPERVRAYGGGGLLFGTLGGHVSE